MITLVIPTYRNPKYLDLCLKSAVENKVHPATQILVVVDGYFEENRSILEKYPDVQYLDLGENHGMQYALNVGVMQATNPYVFIINDDNVMCRDWDDRVRNALPDDERFVLTVDQVEPTGPGMFNFIVNDLGQTVESFQYERWLDYEVSVKEYLEDEPDGHIFPFVIEKKYYLAVGGFDTFYNSPNVCDWDFFLKLELLGFTFPRSRALRLYHFGSVATKKNAESQQFKEREARAFAEYEFKWGAMPYNGPDNTKVHPNGFRGFDGR